MLRLIKKLQRTGLLTVPGVLRLVEAMMTSGVNLMALLRVAAKLHPERVAVVDEHRRLTYRSLWQQSESVAMALHSKYDIDKGQKAAIACSNHASAVHAIFALSRLGVHIFLINPEMSADQITALDERWHFDFYVFDEQLASVFEQPAFRHKSLPAHHPSLDSIERMASQGRLRNVRLKKVKTGNIVVMTGGTTGQPKAASRKPSIVDFLPPFVALLNQINLDCYRSVYVATPVYHGFGLAALILGVVLGAEMYVTRRFNAALACALIRDNEIEVVTLVPLMLQRMLQKDAQALSSLRCIITGGALLSPALAQDTLKKLGPKLFNLYGTSEGGFSIMAPPESLQRKPESIGKPVSGVKARILSDANLDVGVEVVGRLCIRSSWTTNRKNWIETGDLAYRDPDGDIFLCGRVDDMIVSGGENVYPVELENVLVQHPDLEAAAVVGISDPEFGQRLKAVLVKKAGAVLDGAALMEWLKPRIARYQTPALIEFRDELPHTPLGKVDKKALRGITGGMN